MSKDEKVFLSILAFAAKTSEASSCDDFVQEVFAAEKEYKEKYPSEPVKVKCFDH